MRNQSAKLIEASFKQKGEKPEGLDWKYNLKEFRKKYHRRQTPDDIFKNKLENSLKEIITVSKFDEKYLHWKKLEIYLVNQKIRNFTYEAPSRFIQNVDIITRGNDKSHDYKREEGSEDGSTEETDDDDNNQNDDDIDENMKNNNFDDENNQNDDDIDENMNNNDFNDDDNRAMREQAIMDHQFNILCDENENMDVDDNNENKDNDENKDYDDQKIVHEIDCKMRIDVPMINEIDEIFSIVFKFNVSSLPINDEYTMHEINTEFLKMKDMVQNPKIISLIHDKLDIEFNFNSITVQELWYEYLSDTIPTHKKKLNLISIFLMQNYCIYCKQQAYKEISWVNCSKNTHKCK